MIPDPSLYWTASDVRLVMGRAERKFTPSRHHLILWRTLRLEGENYHQVLHSQPSARRLLNGRKVCHHTPRLERTRRRWRVIRALTTNTLTGSALNG